MPKNVKKWSRNQRKFMLWLASDKNSRLPPNQGMLAKQIGVHEATLSRWKRIPGFWEEVTDIARELLRNDLAQIYAAIVREAVRGSYQHAKLALELAGEISPDGEQSPVQIIIKNEGANTFPPHLSSSTGQGADGTSEVQRVSVWSKVGQNGDGH